MRPLRCLLPLLLLAAVPASATDFALALDAGWHRLTASSAAEAVFDGSSGGFTAGGFGRIGLGDHFAVGLGARHFSKSGERVFVASPGTPVYRLGHPLEVRLIPVYALASWRFRPATSWRPYLALGPGLTSYKEESTVGGLTDSESKTKFSAHFAAGIEFGRRTVKLGAEAMYTAVPSTLGLGGVSQVYGSKDAGGFTIVGKLLFGK
jgi:hypothetical protein